MSNPKARGTFVKKKKLRKKIKICCGSRGVEPLGSSYPRLIPRGCGGKSHGMNYVKVFF